MICPYCCRELGTKIIVLQLDPVPPGCLSQLLSGFATEANYSNLPFKFTNDAGANCLAIGPAPEKDID